MAPSSYLPDNGMWRRLNCGCGCQPGPEGAERKSVHRARSALENGACSQPEAAREARPQKVRAESAPELGISSYRTSRSPITEVDGKETIGRWLNDSNIGSNGTLPRRQQRQGPWRHVRAGSTIRIISARRATKQESKTYQERKP